MAMWEDLYLVMAQVKIYPICHTDSSVLISHTSVAASHKKRKPTAGFLVPTSVCLLLIIVSRGNLDQDWVAALDLPLFLTPVLGGFDHFFRLKSVAWI